MTRTLHVTIRPADPKDLEAAIADIEAGEPVEPEDGRLVLDDLETFARVFRGTNLELLQAIVAEEPESIRELSDLVDRHPPDVLGNVRELADYGLLDFEEEGRAKRPVVWYDEIDVDIPLGERSRDQAAV